MKQLQSIPATFAIKRTPDGALAVTIRTYDGVAMVYYADTIDGAWAQVKRDYDAGMMDKEQAHD
jgi:hypothetical protein